MQEKFVKMGKYFYHRYPFLQPFLGFIDRKFFLKAKFSGSGMMTEHELPWNDEYQGEIFRKASNDIKNFERPYFYLNCAKYEQLNCLFLQQRTNKYNISEENIRVPLQKNLKTTLIIQALTKIPTKTRYSV